MNLVWAVVIVVVVAALAIAAMLLVRRGAPAGSYFEDGDRASGVFGVLATGFAVLIGFVVFLSFESFDTSRSGAEAEARIVVQQFETAQFLPVAVRAQLSGELVCYARTVTYQEWPRMESGTIGGSRNPWSLAMLSTLRTTEPRSASEQTAYAKWFDQRSDREDGRADRIHGAEGVIPLPVWIVLLIASGVIFVYMLFFADSAERAIVQATMMGGVAVVITSTLLLLVFLDHPYQSGVGGLRPVAMERALAQIQQESSFSQERIIIPCDSRGTANGA
jgi:ABC-type multidrug transport system fused ATPase/permease subunit